MCLFVSRKSKKRDSIRGAPPAEVRPAKADDNGGPAGQEKSKSNKGWRPSSRHGISCGSMLRGVDGGFAIAGAGCSTAN